MADALSHFFNDVETVKLLDDLLCRGVEPISEATIETGTRFEDLTVLFTGSLSRLTRSEAKKAVENAGGRVVGSMSGSVNLLVCGDNPGSKLQKAKAMGIRVVNEETFLNMIR